MPAKHDTIADLLSAWTDAEIRGDATTLNDLLTDDFVAVGPLGFTLSKTDWLARHESGALKYSDFKLDELTLRQLSDDVVVGTALQKADSTYQGHPTPGTLRVTLVLARGAYGWRLTTSHMSFVAGTPGAPPIPGRG
jgi:ketosteroid isomerase-like protein